MEGKPYISFGGKIEQIPFSVTGSYKGSFDFNIQRLEDTAGGSVEDHS
jgi:hypothetical protein